MRGDDRLLMPLSVIGGCRLCLLPLLAKSPHHDRASGVGEARHRLVGEKSEDVHNDSLRTKDGERHATAGARAASRYVPLM